MLSEMLSEMIAEVGTARMRRDAAVPKGGCSIHLSVVQEIGSTLVGYKMGWVLTGGAKRFSFIRG